MTEATVPEVPVVDQKAIDKANKAAVKAQEKADKETAKAKAKADKEAAAAAAVKPAADSQNGVTRPASGKTKQVWDVADQMSAALKAPVDRKALTDKLLAEGLVVGTIHTQYGKWRKYHGLVTVREPKAEVVAAPVAVPPVPTEASPEAPVEIPATPAV